MDNNKLIQMFSSFNINLNEEQIDNINNLVKTTLITNETFNLTAITDEDEFYEKMVLDSALASIDIDLTSKKAIDVGTGAGFPGLVLYILNPKVNLTLLDSTSKKIKYLENYSKERKFNLSFYSGRMEDYASKNRESFDLAFARAVSSLNILLELIVPVLKVGGVFVALKGPQYDKEIEESKTALKKLDCSVVDIKKYVLPYSKEERSIILIRKNSKTSAKYPRQYSEIKKKPL